MRWDLAALVLLGSLVATMPVFAFRSRAGRPRDGDVAGRPATWLVGYWLRDWMVWVLSPIERLLVRARVSPTMLNMVGLAAGLAAGVAFAGGHFALAAWLLALGGLADILDGRVARARGLASRFGAFMDSVLDRVAETATFVGIAWYATGTVWLTMASVLALAGSLLVSYTRARGEALGVSFAGGLMPRAERLLLLILGGILDASVTHRMAWPSGSVLGGAVAMVAIGATLTAMYRSAVIGTQLAGGGEDTGVGQ